MAERQLKILIIDEGSALNWPAEEAFFAVHPDTEIEYILYTEEQLFMKLQAGKTDADLVILPYSILVDMEKMGYLRDLGEAVGLSTYPEQLIDLSQWLMEDGRLFALPTKISQDYWLFSESAAKKMGLEYPGMKAWSWEDYAELAEKFPMDTDNDGIDDVYLMNGSSISAFPALTNVNLYMLYQYLMTHHEFDTFATKYLNLFKRVLVDDALLDFSDAREAESLKLLCVASGNPVDAVGSNSFDENGVIRFLPPPTLTGEDGPYFGYLWGCAMLEEAGSPDLAKDFCSAMLSENALDHFIAGYYDYVVSKDAPQTGYYDFIGTFMPKFSQRDGSPRYQVRAGRELQTDAFVTFLDGFQTAQEFRSKLTLNPIPFGRDFYDAVHAALQEWLYGNLDDDGLTERMSFLLGIADAR